MKIGIDSIVLTEYERICDSVLLKHIVGKISVDLSSGKWQFNRGSYANPNTFVLQDCMSTPRVKG